MARPNEKDVIERLIALRSVVDYAFSIPPRDNIQLLIENLSEEKLRELDEKATEERDRRWNGLVKAGMWAALSPAEKSFAEATPLTMSHDEHVAACWRAEAMQTLVWALRGIDELPPYSAIADYERLMEQTDALNEGDISLRPVDEIEHEREIAQLWHWRGRMRMLLDSGEEFPTSPELREVGIKGPDDLIRWTAEKAAEMGAFEAPADGDFPVDGMPYRDIDRDRFVEVFMVSFQRHFALNWLCGHAPDDLWDETPTDR